jgi:hypothetical protein
LWVQPEREIHDSIERWLLRIQSLPNIRRHPDDRDRQLFDGSYSGVVFQPDAPAYRILTPEVQIHEALIDDRGLAAWQTVE